VKPWTSTPEKTSGAIVVRGPGEPRLRDSRNMSARSNGGCYSNRLPKVLKPEDTVW